ncbi:hypothetical protein [Lysinibacillus xylanilyticus]|uniref:hypothetical protein n=1 Tax=Lysinibacillus xylanilyticus TaxID=582475 RepID=UPI003CFBFA0A
MLKNGLKYVGFLMMLIFGGIFILRWLIQDELLLDQLIGFLIGCILILVSIFYKKN